MANINVDTIDKNRFRAFCNKNRISMKGTFSYLIDNLEDILTPEDLQEIKQQYPSAAQSASQRWKKIEESIIDQLSEKDQTIQQLSYHTGWTEKQIEASLKVALKGKIARKKNRHYRLKEENPENE